MPNSIKLRHEFGQFDAAKRAYEAANRIDPSAAAHEGLAQVYAASGNPREQLAALSQAYRLNGSNEALRLRRDALRREVQAPSAGPEVGGSCAGGSA